ncbi:MAG TPA: sensor histidine kinase [Bryobacteraceae bacterium]|nr:sensor histidine kinase [Bryobacteraceae bacterium]
MHPIFSRRTWFAGYLGVWAFFALMLAGLIRVPGTLSWRAALLIAAPLCFFYAFCCLTPWYVCRQVSLPRRTWVMVALNHFGAAVLASAMWVELARLMAYLVNASAPLSPEIPQLVVVALLLYSLSVALHYMFLAMQKSRHAEVQAREAELRALKAQINPHFLFNSLNSITALVGSDPARAREMCIRLSDFLRNTLGLGERESISWREELQLARTYLDVEQVRYGARLRVEMNVDEDCSDCLIPPLVLQPLIENAVKHGIASMVDGGTIKVEGHVSNGILEVSVENGFDPDSPAPRRHGLGLRNVRSRLETRFGPEATLTAKAVKNQFRAEMIVPCRRSL